MPEVKCSFFQRFAKKLNSNAYKKKLLIMIYV